MKLNGKLEVSGINTVVINRDVFFVRASNGHDFVTMTAKGMVVRVPSREMVKKIQRFMDNPNYRVWVHEYAVNIVHDSVV